MLTTQLLLLGVMYIRYKSETRDNEINELLHCVNNSLYIRELAIISTLEPLHHVTEGNFLLSALFTL
jgi:hypothetical protein